MRKPSLEWYTLAMCFIAVLALIVTLGISVYSALRMAAPEFTMSPSQFAQFQSNDAFWDVCIQDRMCSDVNEDRPAEKTLTELRKQWYERAVSVEQRAGAQWLVKCLIAGLIAVVVFVLHWILGRRVRAVKAAAEGGDAEKSEKKDK